MLRDNLVRGCARGLLRAAHYGFRLTPAVCKADWITWARLNGVICEEPLSAADDVPTASAACDW